MAVGSERVPRVALDSDHVSGFYTLTGGNKTLAHVTIIVFSPVVTVDANIISPFPRRIVFVSYNHRSAHSSAGNRANVLVRQTDYINPFVIVDLPAQIS